MMALIEGSHSTRTPTKVCVSWFISPFVPLSLVERAGEMNWGEEEPFTALGMVIDGELGGV